MRLFKAVGCRVAITLCLFGMGFCASMAKSDTILFYGNKNIEPFLFQEKGQPAGIVADIFKEINARTDADLVLDVMDWGKAQALARNGAATGLVQLHRNADRETYLEFSEPLLTSEFTIFHRRADISLQSLEDLDGKIVGVENAGYPKSLISQQDGIKKHILKNWAEGFELLAAGEIDAVIVDQWVGEYVLAKTGLPGIVPSIEPLDRLVSHIAVGKAHPEILAQINQAMIAMRSDGSFERILDQWRFSEVVYITKQDVFLNNVVYILFGLVSFMTVFLVFVITRLRRLQRELTFERSILEERVEERTKALKDQTRREHELRREAEKAKAEALELAKTKTNFLAMMSHELRTPLNAVIGFADVLGKTAQGPIDADAVKKYAEIISHSGRDLLHLVNDILDYAKIESGMTELNEKPFEVGHELANIQSAFLMRAKEFGVTLSIAPISDGLMVEGDEIRFRQVVYNLVDNAIKFANGGDVTVSVSVERQGADKVTVDVMVQDTGIGIPLDRQDQIFNLFTQQDGSITRKYGGTGLGLSISRSLTRMMGGDLMVQSEEGVGSCFTARFLFEDLTRLTDAINRAQGLSEPRNHKNFGLTILAVDDVDTNLLVLDAMVDSLGCRIHRFTDPAQAILWAKHNQVDLVLMDIHMPEMDGITCAKEIITHGLGYDAIPFFAWTADVGFQHRAKETDVDWAGVILKPLSESDLISKLKPIALAAKGA